ncbi:hypothetical protein Acr_06g0010720 [Actinidia rufa]|uniref:Uncharacterized protein n=1 Tax=Actinidia rufa TaxID=165716 RepID=A0A7J0ES27_9ERIC|nr:hypothetical protein Acr_06g0010720 [Actinidia rufa]
MSASLELVTVTSVPRINRRRARTRSSSLSELDTVMGEDKDHSTPPSIQHELTDNLFHLFAANKIWRIAARQTRSVTLLAFRHFGTEGLALWSSALDLQRRQTGSYELYSPT